MQESIFNSRNKIPVRIFLFCCITEFFVVNTVNHCDNQGCHSDSH